MSRKRASVAFLDFAVLDAVVGQAKAERPRVPCGPVEWSGDLGRAPRVPAPRYTLDGAKPALAYARNDAADGLALKDVSNPDQAIFDVAAAGAAGQTLAVALPVAGRRLSGPGPETRNGTLRWAASLP